MGVARRAYDAHFAGHPVRIAAAIVVLLVGLGAAWYLGSPLFIRTEAQEELPAFVTAPPGATPMPAGNIPAQTVEPPMPATAVTLRRGELGYVDTIHNGSGPVVLLKIADRHFVRFEDVKITNAPDVHIYLSKDRGGRYVPANTVYLGPLKATNGSFNYEVPPGTDVGAYRSVVVWCRAFAVLITWADLDPLR